MNRRHFLKTSGLALAGTALPVTLVEAAFTDKTRNFTFAFISNAHLQQIKGATFVRNWDMGLKRAVAECNLMDPKPDFVLFGGDLAQLGKPAELDHGAELLFAHFVVLNSILVDEQWINKWETPMARMQTMAGLDDPNGSPFMVGAAQRAWLKQDLSEVSHDTPSYLYQPNAGDQHRHLQRAPPQRDQHPPGDLSEIPEAAGQDCDDGRDDQLVHRQPAGGGADGTG